VSEITGILILLDSWNLPIIRSDPPPVKHFRIYAPDV
jgi:hypothetical protein